MTSLVWWGKMAVPIAWNLSHFCFVFYTIHTHTKMCLSCKEMKNDGLGHNKHMINGWISLDWALEGRVGQVIGNLHIFLLCQPLQIKFIPLTKLTMPRSNLWRPPPSDQIIHNPQLNYYIWFLTNQSRKSPFWVILLSVTFDLLMSHAQNVEKWSNDRQKLVGRFIWSLTAPKPCLYIIKQSFLTALPSAFALLLLR